MAYAPHSPDWHHARAPGRHGRTLACAPAALWTALLLLGLAAPGRTADADGCLRCHGMPTLARRTPTGEVQSLAVDARAFARSEHRRLPCTECHGAGYRQFPHPPANRNLSCEGCHVTRLRPQILAPLVQASAAFRQSVHARRDPHALTCRGCHDPHAFRRWEEVSGVAIRQQNAVCLTCHAAGAPPAGVRTAPDAGLAHRWLPYQKRHLEHVRCLDCHSDGATPASSHRILPAGQSVSDCVACHSSRSILRQKWRRNGGGEAMARFGFLNAAVLNRSYVVGATRNRFLDGFGWVIVLGTVAAAGAHGSLRLWASRRRARPPRSAATRQEEKAQP